MASMSRELWAMEERSRIMEKVISGLVIVMLCVIVFFAIRADVKKP
jgi:hypothetical protein